MSNSHTKNAWGNPSSAKPSSGNPKKTTSKEKKPKNSNGASNGAKANATHLEKFKEVQKKHLQAAQKHIDGYESSSEEELENSSLLESVFKGYGGDKSQLHKTQEFLENAFQSGAATCLICIATVKRTDYVSQLIA